MHVLFNKFASLVGYYQVFFVLFPGQGGFCWVFCAASFVGLFVAVYINGRLLFFVMYLFLVSVTGLSLLLMFCIYVSADSLQQCSDLRWYKDA